MEKRTTVSTFPNPPPFFELYAKEETSLPPPPPINKPYFTFGEYHQFPNDSPPLLHEKITNENDIKTELKRLHNDLMKSYLETLDCLKQRSPNTIHKLIVLETILGNMHYLINLFRPRQAKILISNVLLAQIQQCKNTILQIDSNLQMVRELKNKIKHEDEDNKMIEENLDYANFSEFLSQNENRSKAPVDLQNQKQYQQLLQLQSILSSLPDPGNIMDDK